MDSLVEVFTTFSAHIILFISNKISPFLFYFLLPKFSKIPKTVNIVLKNTIARYNGLMMYRSL